MRHTTCHVASTHSAVLSLGGYLSPVLAGGYLSHVLAGEYPCPGGGEGTPVMSPGREDLSSVLARECPQLGLGIPSQDMDPLQERIWDQRSRKELGTLVPTFEKGSRTRDLGKNLGLGYPPCEQTDTCQNITFRILRMRAENCTHYLSLGNTSHLLSNWFTSWKVWNVTFRWHCLCGCMHPDIIFNHTIRIVTELKEEASQVGLKLSMYMMFIIVV